MQKVIGSNPISPTDIKNINMYKIQETPIDSIIYNLFNKEDVISFINKYSPGFAKFEYKDECKEEYNKEIIHRSILVTILPVDTLDLELIINPYLNIYSEERHFFTQLSGSIIHERRCAKIFAHKVVGLSKEVYTFSIKEIYYIAPPDEGTLEDFNNFRYGLSYRMNPLIYK